MNLIIEIKTTPAEKLPGLDYDQWMSQLDLVIGGKDQFFGNIYHGKESELNQMRKSIEALPKLLLFVEHYTKLTRPESLSIDELKATHFKLATLLSEIKQITSAD
jgi:hypothetical protein